MAFSPIQAIKTREYLVQTSERETILLSFWDDHVMFRFLYRVVAESVDKQGKENEMGMRKRWTPRTLYMYIVRVRYLSGRGI